MKRNKMMRVAGGLLLAVMVTTCAISGTFAKYTTSYTPESAESVRVAGFGVEITANNTANTGVFKNQYDANPIGYDQSGEKISYSVKGTNNTDMILAPGTSGDLADATKLSGTPEVAVKVTYTLDIDFTNWKLTNNTKIGETEYPAGSYYCPLIFRIGEGYEVNGNGRDTIDAIYVCGMDYTNATNFKTALQEAVSKYSAKYQANQNLGELGTDDSKPPKPSIQWTWPYQGADGSNELSLLFTDIAGSNVTIPASAGPTTYLNDSTYLYETLKKQKDSWDTVFGSLKPAFDYKLTTTVSQLD